MAKNLVVVESPAKGKTIERYLGADFKVIASFGHIRDLPKGDLGVDTENNFAPRYVIPAKSRSTLKKLKEAVSKAKTLWLATDYDREGEAISWHIIQALQSNAKANSLPEIKRITFHEITKQAIQSAITNPRNIDKNLVNAQQARRVLDRLVGYKLSPFLWKKLLSGLSAGRVQSVAVRLIVEREREIEAFKPKNYWSIKGIFTKESSEFEAFLFAVSGKPLGKMGLNKSEAVKRIISELKAGAKARISNLRQAIAQKSPLAPFTTSSLQQEASSLLGFSAKQTMRLAQNLYEAGKITYMRTDSTSLAKQAVSTARRFIRDKFGSQYLPKNPITYTTKSKNAQEAHEAIRPTNPQLTPEQFRASSSRHARLYQLIWQRMIASQMTRAKLEKLTIDISLPETPNYQFRANGQRIAFQGFLRVYPSKISENLLPQLIQGDKLIAKKFHSKQHQTKPPARYSEATLVKELEKRGIGRPSTYAPTLSTIQERGYVRLEERRFFPQLIATKMVDLLVKHFPQIVDYQFTAKMEDNLDRVAKGEENWQALMKKFYQPFSENLEKKSKEVKKEDLSEVVKGEKCPDCKKQIIIKLGRFGKFYACQGFPDCKYTRPYLEKIGIPCDKCKTGEFVERRTRRGKIFYGCSGYPKCKNATWRKPSPKKQNLPKTSTPAKEENKVNDNVSSSSVN